METSKYNELVDELAMLVIYALEEHNAYTHEELNEEGFEDKYDCRLTVSTIDSIRAELLMLHQKMMHGQFGMFNADDL